MRARAVVLAVVAAALTLTAIPATGADAAKQRVAVNIKFHTKTFVLLPLKAGPLKRDAGTMIDNAPNAPCRDVIRDGQKVNVCNGGRWTLEGERGTLTIRTQENWVNPGSGGCGIAFGTWKVVRGTGEYARVTGGGRSAYDAHCQTWYARHEGFLTSR